MVLGHASKVAWSSCLVELLSVIIVNLAWIERFVGEMVFGITKQGTRTVMLRWCWMKYKDGSEEG